MPRETNVPYHQNVYDLLDLEPGVCPVASRMIADHEAEFGPLPASVREWYSVPKMVPLTSEEWDRQAGTVWFDYSNGDNSVPLNAVLDQCARFARGEESPRDFPSGRYVTVKNENQGVVQWWIDLEAGEDPPVSSDWNDADGPVLWNPRGAPFSEFVWGWLSHYHRESFTPLSLRYLPDMYARERPPGSKPNETTFWLCTPATPYPIPIIDFLTESLGDPTVRTPSYPKPRREGRYQSGLFGDPIPARPTTGVTQFSFATADGLIRLTTDNLDHPNPHAAWWVAGHTREAFERLRDLLLPWNCFGPDVRTSGDAE